jgi:hypothetical protein
MNAVRHWVLTLPRHAALRLLRGEPDSQLGSTEELRAAVARRFELDLAEWLNQLRKEELRALAEHVQVSSRGAVSDLRARLWLRGAELEGHGRSQLGTAWQPVPIILGGKLCHLGPERGSSPPASERPRPIPPPKRLRPLAEEPDSLEALLSRATDLIGVRLGRARRDKGAFGTKLAALIGVREGGHAEPDWRGEVELKTVPVVRDPSGYWRVKEDPAVSMEGVRPLAKLGRVLWLARVADAADSPLLSWYFQEWDDEVARLVGRHLHRRPKGGAGATTRGWYLHKRFFLESGFLRSLNG